VRDIPTKVIAMSTVRISKWGNSSAVRIPKTMMKELGLALGQKVKLTVVDGRIILEPLRPPRVTLEWIIAETKRLGPENAPETVDWGPDRGSERFYDFD
jgi:antitoxin MazE